VHVQLNLPDNALVVLNTTREDRRGLKAITRVVSLDNRELFNRTDTLDALANRATALAPVPLDAIFAHDSVVLVQLRLMDGGKLVSDNFYWRGKEPASYRALGTMPEAPPLTHATCCASLLLMMQILRCDPICGRIRVW